MTRILLVDDDAFIRESMKLILSLDPELEVIDTCSNGAKAAEYIASHGDIDVVLMDIRMPECDGVEGTKRIKTLNPAIVVLILTTFDDDEYIVEALRNGANGYMLKNVPPDRIIAGIKSVVQGNLLIHHDAAKKLTGLLHQPVMAKNGKSLDSLGLTTTEITVVEKISEGLSNKEIAQEMFLSEGTIKNYISEILSKLNLRDRTQIAIFYLKNNNHN